jgi:hypothetical protein
MPGIRSLVESLSLYAKQLVLSLYLICWYFVEPDQRAHSPQLAAGSVQKALRPGIGKRLLSLALRNDRMRIVFNLQEVFDICGSILNLQSQFPLGLGRHFDVDAGAPSVSTARNNIAHIHQFSLWHCQGQYPLYRIERDQMS